MSNKNCRLYWSSSFVQMNPILSIHQICVHRMFYIAFLVWITTLQSSVLFYWLQTSKFENDRCVPSRKRKSEEDLLLPVFQSKSGSDEECIEGDGVSDLSLSLSLHPVLKSCYTSSTSENSELVTSSSRTNFKECSGCSEGNNINLDLSISLRGSWIQHMWK